MKTQELRIGNYIYKKIHKKDTPLTVVEVLSIDGYFDVLDVKNSEGYITEKFPLNDFERIPLTEEWLLKFGFEEKITKTLFTNLIHFQNKNCWIYLIKDGFEFEIITGDERHKLYKTYKYVHQLQNLYFALTGEELTIY